MSATFFLLRGTGLAWPGMARHGRPDLNFTVLSLCAAPRGWKWFGGFATPNSMAVRALSEAHLMK